MARGAVWTGGFAPKGVYSFDARQVLQNEVGEAYAVLHQYDRHKRLIKLACARYHCDDAQVAHGEAGTVRHGMSPEQGDGTPCIGALRQFHERSDVAGSDVAHAFAATAEECCRQCQSSTCSAFVFSLQRQHCWRKGVDLVDAKVGHALRTLPSMQVGFL